MARLMMICGVIAVLALGAGGCRSGGPSVSGVGILFGTRVVKVGEIVTIKLPANQETGAAEWGVESYDSLKLGLADRLRVERDGDKLVWVIKFKAKTPGETEVVLRRKAGGDETRRYKFQVTL